MKNGDFELLSDSNDTVHFINHFKCTTVIVHCKSMTIKPYPQEKWAKKLGKGNVLTFVKYWRQPVETQVDFDFLL